MRIFDYEYKVQKLEPNGRAVVEYTNSDLGSVTVYMMLPIDMTSSQIHGRIIERFPYDAFYSNYLALKAIKSPDDIRGKMTIDFDDYFYDIQNEATRTEI